MKPSIVRGVLLTFVVLSAGCSAADLADNESIDEFENIATTEEALGEAGCTTTTPHLTITGDFAPPITSPGTYTKPGCVNGHLVDVNAYSDSLGTHGGNIVQYGAGADSSQAECERTRLGVYVWRKNAGGTMTFIGSKWRWGSWVDGGIGGFTFCDVPRTKLINEFPMVQGANYRIGSSARRYSVPRDSGSSYGLRQINYFNPANPR